MQNVECKINEVEGILLFLGVFLCAFLFLCKSSYANPAENLNINAESEYKFSDFERDPEPALSSTGANLSQEYKFYLEGGVLKDGLLDAELGVSTQDKYRQNDADFEDKVRFDYGRILRIETETTRETDEEIFFSATTEPQSPIYTIRKKYDGRLALDSVSEFEYILDQNERNDLLLGTVTGEKTKTQILRFRSDRGPLSFESEYRKSDFDDLLGVRSDISSTDLNFNLSYRPVKYFGISGFFEESKDEDLDRSTELNSRNSRLELELKPLNELKLRNRFNIREDEDTNTGEDITNTSDEVILNFIPVKQVDLQLNYKKEDEDKNRDSSSIVSEIDEKKVRLRIKPVSELDLQSGYEVSDKSSSSAAENIKNTKVYADIAFEPLTSIRLSTNYTNTTQKNTFTSLTESDTKSILASLQYRGGEKLSFYFQADTSKTDNPSTGAFTKTDTLSSNLNIDLFSFLDVVARSSLQETSGSSASALAKRLLSSIEFNARIFDNLKLSTEYEFIDSSGASASNEDLFDVAVFYNIGKFDFSLRLQKRDVAGVNALDKTTVLSNIKYRFTKNAVLSFRFSLIDFSDKEMAANSYDSTTLESILSMRF
ncbi:MAG: hypothetical protein COV72_02565 [Candidatus Omnitrophica bacterium CG11_big_fil_rev_8_21_14_0_20_42_13]|uniref:Uncharacterized protein n=1 Tax=Candidatus Ghiorseimicrobium undicola TaxID=1974746 RepID=A0A2H0LYS4_9BACT|nr:MAG: hypothetical protein COV72_02565 [Candidatus Omnitrophica bacterium CG11_big_fil_rev_8_21_14_0_20_42_13]